MTTTFYVARPDGVRERLDITSHQRGVPYLFSSGTGFQNVILDKRVALARLRSLAADPAVEVYRVVGRRAERVSFEPRG